MLKDITYTGKFEQATCGLAYPFRDGYAVGCGVTGKLEHFEYTLEDGKTRSSVALCEACAAQQMRHHKVRIPPSGTYQLLVNETVYGSVWRSQGGWACKVVVAGGEYTLWDRTLGEAEVEALKWYRYFTKRVS